MSLLLSLTLLSSAADISSEYSRNLQTCIVDTSRLWASKPGEPIRVVERAEIYCHKHLDSFLIAQEMENKKLGLNVAQSDEYNAILAASLLRIARDFAVRAVEKARSK